MVFSDEQIQAVRDKIAAKEAEKKAETERILAPLRKKAAEEQAARLKAKAEVQQAAAEAHQRRLAEEFDAKHKPGALRAWRANGGDEKSFNEAWPQLRQEILTRETTELQAKARASVTSRMHHLF